MEAMQQHLKDEVVGNGSVESLVVQPARWAGNGVTETTVNVTDVSVERAREDSMNQKPTELNGSTIEAGKVLSGKRYKSSVYLDEDGEASKTVDVKASAEIGNVADIQSLVSAALGSAKDAGNTSGAIEEEVIELEFFNRAIDKLHTHDAYCPNCRSPISKVVLRIKRETRSVDPPPNQDDNLDLLGCLSCFRIFLPSRITGESKGRPEQKQESDNASEGKCFDLHWIFGQRVKEETSQKQPSASMSSDRGQKPNDGHLSGDSSAATSSSSHDSNGTQKASTPLLQGIQTPALETDDNATKQDVKHEPQYFGKPFGSPEGSIFDLEGGPSGGVVDATAYKKPEPEIREGNDVHIPIDDSQNEAGTSTSTQVPKPESEKIDSKSIEVAKSIVYGGLMESITSLSVVSSAAASGATTLNTITIGVANLIGGLFVIAHNLLDLCTNRPANEYQEVLGQRKHFLLHVIVALFSYLIFGLAPPVIYGFTFRESDDRDFKLLAVAVTSFVCIILLAIGKAYTRGANTFKEYFLTILQYATAAATASGVAYAVGDLFQKLMDDLGWFNSSPTDAPLLPNVKSPNSNWASY